MATSAKLTQALRRSHAMGPSVRNLLSQYKLDPSQITSTGPHQTLLKGDVLSYLNERSNQGQHKSSASQSQSTWGPLSAPKPGTNRSSQINIVPHLDRKYARRTLTELEIMVINSGGLIEVVAKDTQPKKR